MSSREEELLQRVEGLVALNQRDAERVARQDAPREAERAEAARSGALGPDWRDVQQRIDRGQTSLTAVFSGADDSPAAVRLRGVAQQAVVTLPPELADELEALEEELR